MCNTLLTSTIIVAFLVAVTEAQDFAGSDFVWKDSLKELLTVYNHSADEDIDHAIDEHWESVKLFASTVRPNLTAEQLEEGIFLERTIESRVAISTELDTCISSQLAAKPIAAISVHDKIKKKILNNRRFSQIEILRFCPNTRANCTNIAAIGNQVAVCTQSLAGRKLIALNPVTKKVEVDIFWLPSGCSCVVKSPI